MHSMINFHQSRTATTFPLNAMPNLESLIAYKTRVNRFLRQKHESMKCFAQRLIFPTEIEAIVCIFLLHSFEEHFYSVLNKSKSFPFIILANLQIPKERFWKYHSPDSSLNEWMNADIKLFFLIFFLSFFLFCKQS